jgi:cystathionine gamma-lyase
MQQHGKNALALAQHLLADTRRVAAVHYHGLASSPGRHLAWRQLSREACEWIEAEGFSTETGFPYGGMLTVRLKVGDQDVGEAAGRFLAALRLFTLAESLGGVEVRAG